MTLELTAIPLAFLAGVVGVMSPCVWPLVPVVTASAATGGRSGPFYLAAGLSSSFAVAGTFLTLLVASAGLDPELFRYIAASILVTVGLVLVVQRFGDRATLILSRLSSRVDPGAGLEAARSPPGQFMVGALLGIVWLPCVGPTLGVAIALASFGQDLIRSFAVMLSYGIGTAGVLLAAGLASSHVLRRWRPAVAAGGGIGKMVLGWTVIILGVFVLTGFDKRLERLGVNILPDWVFGF